MFKPLLISLTAALLLAAAGGAQTPSQPKKSALDKAALETYIRHLYVMDSRVNILVNDPKPSEVPGFFEVGMHASVGPQTQDFKFLVSKDGSKILQASVFDINKNPFKDDLDKIKTTGAPDFGTPGAPVVLVQFSDFQCPYCKEEAKMLRENLLKAYPTEVRLYFKTYPLESLHPWAKSAAIASRCVSKQSPPAFWSYHDWIFEHQAEITPDNLKNKVLEWSKTATGVDQMQLAACIDNKSTAALVDADIADAHALDVSGTPTLFINGRRIDRTIDWANLKTIIDFEVGYQKTAKDAGDDCGCNLQLNLPFSKQTTPADLTKKK